LIGLDKFTITYPRPFQAANDVLTFKAIGNAFKVTNFSSADVVVYAISEDGSVERMRRVKVEPDGATYAATFAGTGQLSTYIVSTASALHIPLIEATRLKANLNQPAQYLILAHPSLISDIQPLVQARQAQGLTVSVVDVNDLYAQYSYGILDPMAIKAYISYAVQNLGTEYVLLVGGDTYDYRNYLGLGSISFIPSLYMQIGIVYHVPTDALYADVDSDNVPDVVIGRLPARTSAQLKLLVDKTLAYNGKGYGQTAVFAADKYDTNAGLSFKNINSQFVTMLPSHWQVTNVNLDDLSVSDARRMLIDAMNAGPALVTYTGHSSQTTWSSSNLFNTSMAASLKNTGRPYVTVQWGCWNTYYVDPVNTYLLQSLLFSGDKGAVAVLGATTLTEAKSEAMLGNLLMPRMVEPGKTIGMALQEAKVELAKTNPDLLDVLLGWTLMGDPALLIEP